MVEDFLYMSGKRFHGKCMDPFLHYAEAKIGMLEFQKEVAMTILASFGRNNPAKSLPFPRYVVSNVKLHTKIHILVKSTTKYCRCKHCGGRSIYFCKKCNVVLHPDCFKDYHL